jgi:hypothetical protein
LRISLAAPQQQCEVVQPLDPVAEPGEQIAFLSGRDIPYLGDGGVPLGAALRIHGQRVQGEEPLVAEARHSAFERRERLGQKRECGMPVGLIERGPAEPLGLALAEPEPNRGIFAGRAAQRRLSTVQGHQKHRRCPGHPSGPSTPPGAHRKWV